MHHSDLPSDASLTTLSQPPPIHALMHHSDLPSDALLRLSQLVRIYLVMQYFGSPSQVAPSPGYALLRLYQLLRMYLVMYYHDLGSL
jgi:hypothetical protein